MATLTEIVAAVVVHSSAAAYSHFGIALEPVQRAQPPVEKSVARTAIRKSEKIGEPCPEERARVVKV